MEETAVWINTFDETDIYLTGERAEEYPDMTYLSIFEIKDLKTFDWKFWKFRLKCLGSFNKLFYW